MLEYRLYCLDRNDKISTAEWIQAIDDKDAVEQARALKRGARKCEVWKRNTLVASLNAAKLSGAQQSPAYRARGDGVGRASIDEKPGAGTISRAGGSFRVTDEFRE